MIRLLTAAHYGIRPVNTIDASLVDRLMADPHGFIIGVGFWRLALPDS
jgi:hypothetical protein